jgi:glucosyl-dolichyl phosphate glucuronosyltransferase
MQRPLAWSEIIYSTQRRDDGVNDVSAAALDLSVVVATHNRAAELTRTLASLAECHADGDWEVIIVDNNSVDSTRQVVEAAQSKFPASLSYLFEPIPGRSAALNAGIRVARGATIVTTDDDVRVNPDWLNAAAAGLQRHNCHYLTGRVEPLWPDAPPRWFPKTGGVVWGVLGLLDFGAVPVPLVGRAPIGVNAAFRRAAFDRVGLFNPILGRKAGTLLGQEMREWHIRARSAGILGFYVPDMVVRHVIPRERVTKRYFRHWFYWHGISRAILYREYAVDMESPEHTALDFERIPHVLGTPRYLFGSCIRALFACCAARLRGDDVAAFQHELKVWRFAGIFRQRLADRHLPVHSSPLAASLRAQNVDVSGRTRPS